MQEKIKEIFTQHNLYDDIYKFNHLLTVVPSLPIIESEFFYGIVHSMRPMIQLLTLHVDSINKYTYNEDDNLFKSSQYKVKDIYEISQHAHEEKRWDKAEVIYDTIVRVTLFLSNPARTLELSYHPHSNEPMRQLINQLMATM